MQLTSLDYKYLEPLALETFRNLTQTNMGSLVAESTIGRKFLVDMLFEQVADKLSSEVALLEKKYWVFGGKESKKQKDTSTGKSQAAALAFVHKEIEKEKQIVRRTIAQAANSCFTEEELKQAGLTDTFMETMAEQVDRQSTKATADIEYMLTALQQQVSRTERKVESALRKKANFFSRMWDRFKSFFSRDSKLRRFFAVVKSALKKHWKIATIVFGLGVVIGIAVLMIKYKKSVNRGFLKRIGVYIWNAVKWPFAKIRAGVTWLINKIKSLFGKKGVVESALDKELTFSEFQFLAESLVLEAEQEGEGEKGIARRAVDFVTKWAKKIGWKAPKTVVSKAINLTLKKFDLTDATKSKKVAQDLIEAYSKRLERLKKVKEKLGPKQDQVIKSIDQQIKATKSIIRRLKVAKWTNILTVVFMVCVVAALIAIAYYVVKKVR